MQTRVLFGPGAALLLCSVFGDTGQADRVFNFRRPRSSLFVHGLDPTTNCGSEHIRSPILTSGREEKVLTRGVRRLLELFPVSNQKKEMNDREKDGELGWSIQAAADFLAADEC